MTEPTRPIRQPTVDADGSLVARSVVTPKAFKVRAKVTVGSRRVIPVIFVPGIMGSNLRVRVDADAKRDDSRTELPSTGRPGKGAADRANNDYAKDKTDLTQPGAPAWRPPNGYIDGLFEAFAWKQRKPDLRQKILHPSSLEVDDDGELGDAPPGLSQEEMRARGWGEVHQDSYGAVLIELQKYLDTTFRLNVRREREIRDHWKRVMQCDPARWGVRKIARITESELEHYAAFQYPVYAVGYNWLESCAASAQRLSQRIDEIKHFWNSRKHECERVIIVTHSMGGLVARACARSRAKDRDDPADIAGIIHGVMPALGAPVAYRRIAGGTEGERYSNGFIDNLKANRFVDIAGTTPEQTTAVMATSPGVLELLPNHLYPRPWLLVKTLSRVNNEDKEQQVLALPAGDPYEMYRDTESWYRVINPHLADPAGLFKNQPGGVAGVIRKAIDAAEHMHREILTVAESEEKGTAGSPYYHPNTYAFYGSDADRRAYGTVSWAARVPPANGTALTSANTANARPAGYTPKGGREVVIEGRTKLRFHMWGQDAPGDDTVPRQSASGVDQHVRATFAATGFGHQECFTNGAMLLLTRHLIVKIVQGIK
ncbi:hypothetical protein G4G28_11420 [Massilia sp. Dwa41.01b]|uniref:esterase/lipase family protein n=1 Tax=unclassified Massilia TaxID=2609279 RepID=UPI0016018CD8|nr:MULTISPECIES: hypothetical protein [unclassified Massilia]QNA88944.1 hypothetical protein G4G28_11420 [Massilia sp. Dwa41.01b]QNA99832.1 hypothetical protein G4G31_15055 [Massilia sp. Se16.2.3]